MVHIQTPERRSKLKQRKMFSKEFKARVALDAVNGQKTIKESLIFGCEKLEILYCTCFSSQMMHSQ